MTQDDKPALETPAASAPDSRSDSVQPTTTETPGQAPSDTAPVSSSRGRSPALKTFLGGFAGGIAVTALAAGGLVLAWPNLRSDLLSSENAQLTRLDRAVDDLNPRLSALERRQADGTSEADLAVTVQALTQRVAALENQARGPSADPRVGALSEQITRQAADITRLSDETEALHRAIPPEGTILRLAERAEAAEKQARDIANRHASAQALLLVVGQLREALDRGDPYPTELRAARRVATDEDTEALDALAAGAAKGIARRDALTAAFPGVSEAVLRAAVVAPDGDLWQRSLDKLSSLVSVRRIDGKGEGTAAIVARAEKHVKNGDLTKAVEELSELKGDPAQVAGPWIKSASDRVAADQAMSQLAASAAAQTAKAAE